MAGRAPSPGVVGVVGVLGVSGVTMPVPMPINMPGAAADAGANGREGREGPGCAKTVPARSSVVISTAVNLPMVTSNGY